MKYLLLYLVGLLIMTMQLVETTPFPITCVFLSFRMNLKKFLETFLRCMLWGMLLHFMAGYFYLHSWSNLFGELLRFADREFYSVREYVDLFP